MKKIQIVSLVFSLTFLEFCTSASRYKRIENFQPPKNLDNYEKAQRLSAESKSLFQARLYKESIVKAEASIAILPMADAYFNKGLSETRLENYTEAEMSFARAQTLDPSNEQILLTYAISSKVNGNVKNSEETFKKLNELKPNDPVYEFQYALNQKDQQKYEKAIHYFQKAAEHGYEPKESVYLQLAEIYTAQSNEEKANEYFAKATAKNPNSRWAKEGKAAASIRVILKKGKLAMHKKDYRQAAVYFEEGVKMNSKMAVPNLLLGICNYNLKKYKDAEKNFLNALNISHTLEDAYIYLSRTYVKRGKHDSALETVNNGLKANRSSHRLYLEKGLIEKNRGNLSEAISQFQSSKSKKPSFFDAYAEIIVLNLEEDQIKDAEIVYQEAVAYFKDFSNDSVQKRNLKRFAKLIEINKFESKVESLVEARKLREAKNYIKSHSKLSNTPQYYYQKGKVCLAEKKQCESDFEKSLSYDSKYFLSLLELKAIYQLRLRKNKNDSIALAKLKAVRAKINKRGNSLFIQDMMKGIAFEKNNNLLLAKKYYSKLKRKYPDKVVVKKRLAYVYLALAEEASSLKKPNYALATSYIKQAEFEDKSNPDIPELRNTIKENQAYAKQTKIINEAKTLEKKQKYKKAVKKWQEVYKKLPYPSILYRYLMASQRAEIPSSSLENDVKNGDKRFIKRPTWLLLRGRYYLQAGNDQKALTSFDQYKKINAKNPKAHYYQGLYYLKKKDYSLALISFEESLNIRPQFYLSNIARALIFHNQKKHKLSRVTLQKVLAEEKTNKTALLNLGVSLFSTDDFNSAEGPFKSILNENQKEDVAWFYLGFMNYLKKNYRKAETQLSKAVALAPREEYLYGLAKTQEKLGKTKEKRKTIRTLITLYPSGVFTSKLSVGSDLKAEVNPETLIGKLENYNSVEGEAWAFNNQLVFINEQALYAHDVKTGRTNWKKPLALKPIRLAINKILFLLYRNKIELVNPQNGETISNIFLPEGGAQNAKFAFPDRGLTIYVEKRSNAYIIDSTGKVLKKFSAKPTLAYFEKNGFYLFSTLADKFDYYSTSCIYDVKCKPSSGSLGVGSKILAMNLNAYMSGHLHIISANKHYFISLENGKSKALNNSKKTKSSHWFAFQGGWFNVQEKKIEIYRPSGTEQSIALPKLKKKSKRFFVFISNEGPVVLTGDNIFTYHKNKWTPTKMNLLTRNATNELFKVSSSKQVYIGRSMR